MNIYSFIFGYMIGMFLTGLFVMYIRYDNDKLTAKKAKAIIKSNSVIDLAVAVENTEQVIRYQADKGSTKAEYTVNMGLSIDANAYFKEFEKRGFKVSMKSLYDRIVFTVDWS